MPELVPSARRASRLVAAAGIASAALPGRLGRRAQEAITLAALAIGMPHGAADTELLRVPRQSRHLALLAGYAGAAAASTLVVKRGGSAVERAVLLASALHFAEGELATWPAAPRSGPLSTALRLTAAGTATAVLPAMVTAANRRGSSVAGNCGRGTAAGNGDRGAAAADGSRGVSGAPGWALLRHTPPVGLAAATAVTTAAAAGLLATGDLVAAGDTALLGALALAAPPGVGFASYFGGWHSLRHTARVVDSLVARSALPPQDSLPRAVVALGRRSAWASAAGVAMAGALVARDPKRASDNAFAAVLGLTVPHMATVAARLSRRAAG